MLGSSEMIADKLKPLVDIAKAEDITGLARGIAFRMGESFGILKRETVAEEIKSLDQTARAQLRKYGVRFGAFNIYFPLLLKPAAAELALTLWCLKHGAQHGLSNDALPEPPRAGLTSVPVGHRDSGGVLSRLRLPRVRDRARCGSISSSGSPMSSGRCWRFASRRAPRCRRQRARRVTAGSS